MPIVTARIVLNMFPMFIVFRFSSMMTTYTTNMTIMAVTIVPACPKGRNLVQALPARLDPQITLVGGLGGQVQWVSVLDRYSCRAHSHRLCIEIS